MKNLRRLCAGLILTLALAAPTLAGQMDCPGITQEPPQSEQTLTSETDYGVVDVLANILVTALSAV